MLEWKDAIVPIHEPEASILLTPTSKLIVAKSGRFYFTTLSVGLFLTHDSMDTAKAAAIGDLLPHVRQALTELERAAAEAVS